MGRKTSQAGFFWTEFYATTLCFGDWEESSFKLKFLFFPSTPNSWLEGILDNHQKGANHPIFYIINELYVDQFPQY